MSNCPTCKESIFSQTKSLIGETQCTQPCPPEITCEDFIASNCVYYSGATLSCPSGSVSVNYNDTITVALNKMFQLLCQNTSSCTTKITADDTCCGYLFDKITSSSLNLTVVTNNSGCKQLNIEEKCRTWTELTKSNLGLAGTWNWAQSGFARPAVSSVDNCIVRLAGTISRSSIGSSGNTLIGTLPSGKTPNNIRRFSVNFTTSLSYPLNIIPSFITILTNGEMYLNNPYGFGPLSNVTVSLDGISFETGTII